MNILNSILVLCAAAFGVDKKFCRDTYTACVQKLVLEPEIHDLQSIQLRCQTQITNKIDAYIQMQYDQK